MQQSILIAGDDRLSFSIAVCLMQSGDHITLYTSDVKEARKCIDEHITDARDSGLPPLNPDSLQITDQLNAGPYFIAIVVTEEDLAQKNAMVKQMERKLDSSTIIAVNAESISLIDLQKAAVFQERLIGLNWTEPAHTTYFLEIISSDRNKMELVGVVLQKATEDWGKDPYRVHNQISIRARLFGAMVREAFFLVENGYATIQDIDRACRNDAGYYLPFAGNFRYMDLMGTYSYAEVMKKLNADLSNDDHLPDFFTEIVANGELGMKNNKGFYNYENGDVEHWNRLFAKFSYKIHDIMTKYPFKYKE